MTRTAKLADKITVVRSMTHGEADHDRGTHNMFTGYRPSPAIQYPSFGSIVSHELGFEERTCRRTSAFRISRTILRAPGISARRSDRFSLGNDPGEPPGSRCVTSRCRPGSTEKRFATRREMRAAVDAHFSAIEKSDALDGMDSFYQRAYSMISSDKARAAFAIQDEPEKLREEYGQNQAGQRMLLARRLVEAGVRFVSLTYGGWDHHDNIRTAMNSQLPKFDQAFAALIRDLDQRGMLAIRPW
jgi:hypothetical protein